MNYLREENNSKKLVIKILAANQSTFKGSLPQQSKPYKAYYDSDVPFINPKKVKCRKKKDTPYNSSESPNRFFNFSTFNNDVMIMETNCHDKDPANSSTKENTDKWQNLIKYDKWKKKK